MLIAVDCTHYIYIYIYYVCDTIVLSPQSAYYTFSLHFCDIFVIFFVMNICSLHFYLTSPSLSYLCDEISTFFNVCIAFGVLIIYCLIRGFSNCANFYNNMTNIDIFCFVFEVYVEDSCIRFLSYYTHF